MEIKRIDLRDRDLVRALVVESWETIFPDIGYIDSPLELSDGVLCDIIGVDEEKRLVLCFILLPKDDHGLIEIIKSFDWIKQNIRVIKRVYPQSHFETSIPSLIIISHEFSDEFLKVASYLNLPEISLYRYLCLEVDGSKGIVLDRMADYHNERDVQSVGQGITQTEDLCLKCLGITREEERDLLSGY